MSFKAFIRNIFPPILYKFFSKVQELILKKQLLFPGYDMLFKKTLNDTMELMDAFINDSA